MATKDFFNDGSTRSRAPGCMLGWPAMEAPAWRALVNFTKSAEGQALLAKSPSPFDYLARVRGMIEARIPAAKARLAKQKKADRSASEAKLDALISQGVART